MPKPLTSTEEEKLRHEVEMRWVPGVSLAAHDRVLARLIATIDAERGKANPLPPPAMSSDAPLQEISKGWVASPAMGETVDD